MLSILINAYACSPGMGSEPGMAWNWCANLANYCELHIITEGEFRDRIEAVVPTLPQGRNMHFYYNPVSDEVRRMCWNQGDWRFYKHYKGWQKKTYLMAKEICSREKIDILHQLNMIGFREPGYLWKLAEEVNKPFVWGPIGGLKQFPVAYLRGASWKTALFNRIKNIINVMQVKYDKRVDKALRRADLLISSIPDSYKMIKKYKGLESVIIPETGCHLNLTKRDVDKGNNSLRLLWVGKFDFRKQLEIALRTIAAVSKSIDVRLDVCGSGNGQQEAYYKNLAVELGINENVTWHGNIGNDEVLGKMQTADLFFFTSVSEDTSTVVLEAVSCGLPVLCFDACGFGYVINGKVGMKIPLTNPQQSVKDFSEKIIYLYNHKDVLNELSLNCKQRQVELSWDNKIKAFLPMLEALITPPRKLTIYNNNRGNLLACCFKREAA